jgi:beta-barrel assembly-enhancing protease
MSDFFYNLGRRLGHAAVPAIRRSRWIWNNLTGTEADALQAEQSLGAALATELRNASLPSQNPDAARLIHQLCQQLAAAQPDQRRTFRADLFQSNPPNAIALPGGFLFLSDSLVDLCAQQADELAFVLAHEMAHVLLGHAWDRMLNQTVLSTASVVAGRAGPLGSWLRQHGLQLLQTAHARKGEYEADRLGLELVLRAKFDPAGAVRLFDRLEPLASNPTQLGQYFASHPPVAERRARIQALRNRRQPHPDGP